jgi:hypothetical protein
VDDFLEIGSGVAGAPGSCHAVDDGRLMGMDVESIGIVEVIVIILLGNGNVDEVIDQVLGHTFLGEADSHKCLSFLNVLIILPGVVSGLVSADSVFTLCRMAVVIL